MLEAHGETWKPLALQTADDLIKALVDLETIKTWSLLVTLFGDQGTTGKAADLSGKQISAFMSPIGIKPEAVRVALHRLKKDGWVTSQKAGREVVYQLSAKGLAETKQAYVDVYRRDVKYPEGWHIILVPDHFDKALKSPESVQLARNIWLQPREMPNRSAGSLALQVQGKELPDWMEDGLVSPQMRSLAARLANLAIAHPDLDKQTQSAIRLLLVHRWRKLALRAQTWAHIGLFPDGALAHCHRHIADRLDFSAS